MYVINVICHKYTTLSHSKIDRLLKQINNMNIHVDADVGPIEFTSNSESSNQSSIKPNYFNLETTEIAVEMKPPLDPEDGRKLHTVDPINYDDKEILKNQLKNSLTDLRNVIGSEKSQSNEKNSSKIAHFLLYNWPNTIDLKNYLKKFIQYENNLETILIDETLIPISKKTVNEILKDKVKFEIMDGIYPATRSSCVATHRDHHKTWLTYHLKVNWYDKKFIESRDTWPATFKAPRRWFFKSKSRSNSRSRNKKRKEDQQKSDQRCQTPESLKNVHDKICRENLIETMHVDLGSKSKSDTDLVSITAEVTETVPFQSSQGHVDHENSTPSTTPKQPGQPNFTFNKNLAKYLAHGSTLPTTKPIIPSPESAFSRPSRSRSNEYSVDLDHQISCTNIFPEKIVVNPLQQSTVNLSLFSSCGNVDLSNSNNSFKAITCCRFSSSESEELKKLPEPLIVKPRFSSFRAKGLG